MSVPTHSGGPSLTRQHTRCAGVSSRTSILKAAYLRCERAATERLLGAGNAANCSAIYEELLKVGFGGDFKRLLAWWHAERVAEARGQRIARP